jgi:SpoVK/Ycf46/Vps4 family AAA+-type ATPase
VDLEKISRRTPGFTGADLQNLMNEAAILAARRNLKEISKEEIADALERIIAGVWGRGAGGQEGCCRQGWKVEVKEWSVGVGAVGVGDRGHGGRWVDMNHSRQWQ